LVRRTISFAVLFQYFSFPVSFFLFGYLLSAFMAFQPSMFQFFMKLEASRRSKVAQKVFKVKFLELQGLDGLDEEQVLALLGEPETTDINMRKDSHPTPEMPYAPKYLVYPVDFGEIDHAVISPEYHVTSSPKPDKTVGKVGCDRS
jgi:hypothetical protein